MFLSRAGGDAMGGGAAARRCGGGCEPKDDMACPVQLHSPRGGAAAARRSAFPRYVHGARVDGRLREGRGRARLVQLGRRSGASHLSQICISKGWRDQRSRTPRAVAARRRRGGGAAPGDPGIAARRRGGAR